MAFKANLNINGNSRSDMVEAYKTLQDLQQAIKKAQRDLCQNVAHGRNYVDPDDAVDDRETIHAAIHAMHEQNKKLMGELIPVLAK